MSDELANDESKAVAPYGGDGWNPEQRAVQRSIATRKGVALMEALVLGIAHFCMGATYVVLYMASQH